MKTSITIDVEITQTPPSSRSDFEGHTIRSVAVRGTGPTYTLDGTTSHSMPEARAFWRSVAAAVLNDRGGVPAG